MFLVTGGGGFIGSQIAHELVRRGHRVRVFDSGSSAGLQRLCAVPAEIEWYAGDVRDEAALTRALRGVEVVFHHAAVASVQRSIVEPDVTHAVNLTGTLNVLVAAQRAGVRRVVFASSSAVYGDLPGSPKSESMPVLPLSPYAAQKLAGEQYCQLWHSLYGLETVALRYFNVFGPGQDPRGEYAAVIPKVITTVLSGGRPIIFGDGQQSRDFIYISNVVEANLRAAVMPAAVGRVINVGAGSSITLNHFIAQLSRVIGHEIHPIYAAPRLGDVRESVADISRLRASLDYRPTVSFREGIERMVEAFAGRPTRHE
jgi:UDP-glucose 4-epimerase